MRVSLSTLELLELSKKLMIQSPDVPKVWRRYCLVSLFVLSYLADMEGLLLRLAQSQTSRKSIVRPLQKSTSPRLVIQSLIQMLL